MRYLNAAQFNLVKYRLAKIVEVDSGICQTKVMHSIKYFLTIEINTLTDYTHWLFYILQLQR